MLISIPRALLLFFILTVSVSAQPCLQVDGLDFGTLSVGQSRTLDLELCNNGTGEITFQEPWLTQYDSQHFTVEDSQLDILRNRTLRKGQCIRIKVTFKADAFGDYETVGRFWANTRLCVDTSEWRATVVKPGPLLTPMSWGDRWVVTANPCTKSGIDCYEGEVELSNAGSQPFEVADIRIIDDRDGAVDDASYFDLVTTDPTRNIVPTDVVNPSQRRRQKLCFRPDAERDYHARVRVVTGNGDTVYGELRGTGIESHIKVPEQITFPPTLLGQASDVMPVRIESPGAATGPLTITEFRVTSPDFVIGTPVMRDGSTQSIGPWVLLPGDFLDLPIQLIPQSPGFKMVTLEIIGDHSRCDDSTTLLIGAVTSSITTRDMESGNVLGQNDPNPVVGETRIELVLARGGNTRLEIFDSEGRRVASILDGYREAGTHHVTWNPHGLPAGIYSYRIVSGEWTSVRQLVLVR